MLEKITKLFLGLLLVAVAIGLAIILFFVALWALAGVFLLLAVFFLLMAVGHFLEGEYGAALGFLVMSGFFGLFCYFVVSALI